MFNKKEKDTPKDGIEEKQILMSIAEIDKKMSSIESEPTKYTELGARLYPAKDNDKERGLHFATELSSLDEVSDIDRLETWTVFAPQVYIPKGITEDAQKHIQHNIDSVEKMVYIHLLNKAPYKRRRSLEFVHAVKQDVGIPATEKSVNSMLRGGK